MDKFKEERPEWISDFILAKVAVKWNELYRFSEIGMFYAEDEIWNENYGDPRQYEGTKLMARFGWAESWRCEPTYYVPF